jgi:hypothetical protein
MAHWNQMETENINIGITFNSSSNSRVSNSSKNTYEYNSEWNYLDRSSKWKFYSCYWCYFKTTNEQCLTKIKEIKEPSG